MLIFSVYFFSVYHFGGRCACFADYFPAGGLRFLQVNLAIIKEIFIYWTNILILLK